MTDSAGPFNRFVHPFMDNDSRPIIQPRKFYANTARARVFLPGEKRFTVRRANATPMRRTIKRAAIRRREKNKKKDIASLQTKLSHEQKHGVPIERGEAAKRFFTKFGSVKVLIDS